MAPKADTTIDQLLTLIDKSTQDPQSFDKLTKTLSSMIPVQKGRNNMSKKVDDNLNQTFKIKRLNYSILAKVIKSNEHLYTVEILSIVEGESNFKPGDKLQVSKAELRLTGKKVR